MVDEIDVNCFGVIWGVEWVIDSGVRA